MEEGRTGSRRRHRRDARPGHGPGLRVRVGDERLLSRDDQVLPTRLGQEVRPVGLQPVAVALEPLESGPDSGRAARGRSRSSNVTEILALSAGRYWPHDAIVFRVRGLDLGPRLPLRVGDECFLTRDRHQLPPRLGQEFVPDGHPASRDSASAAGRRALIRAILAGSLMRSRVTGSSFMIGLRLSSMPRPRS